MNLYHLSNNICKQKRIQQLLSKKITASIIVNQIGDPNFSNVKIPPIISAKNHVKGFNIVDFDPLASERERSSLIPVMDITIII